MADGEDFILGQANDSTSETTLHRAAANTVGAALTVKNDKGEGVSGTGGPDIPVSTVPRMAELPWRAKVLGIQVCSGLRIPRSVCTE
jgi:hypothetical protein